MGYLYVAESEHLMTDSESQNPTTSLWCLSSGKVSLRPFSWRGWKQRRWRRLLSGTRLSRSTVDRIVASQISLLRASRACRGVALGNGAESMMPDGYGTISPESLPSLNRRQSCLKMSKGSAVTEVSLASLPTLPRSGLLRHGTCFPQPESERRTAVAGSTWSRGEYPTPAASDYRTTQNDPKGDHKRPTNGTASLSTWARKLWPTATATDHKASGGARYRTKTRHTGTTLTDAVCRSGRQHQTICRHGGACQWIINPLFVAWLMGLPPIGVNGSTQSETLLYRWLQRMRTEFCRLG